MSNARSLAEKNATISKALDQNKMLVKEVHHRVKNNLQVVSSLLYLQSRYIDDNSAKDALQAGRSRVQAMSLLHQKLYQTENIQDVAIKPYFTELFESIVRTYKVSDTVITHKIDVANIYLDIQLVIPMGLIVNEMLSNALEHAFDGQATGFVLLDIQEMGDDIRLVVSDNGSGLPYDSIPERSTSLGLELIKSFSEKIDAEMEIKNQNGTTYILTFSRHIDTSI